jgi:SNF2 family DNA or RNA helicase
MRNFNSLIIDNYKNGKLIDWLRKEIKPNSRLSFVSAFFTIYAYKELKESLESIEELRFLFGEPNFKTQEKPERAFSIQDNEIQLSNQLEQSGIARECEEWIRQKVQIRSVKKSNFLHGKLYHIQQENGVKNSVLGSSNFTHKGLGCTKTPNLELNTITDSNRLNEELLQWFNELWDNKNLVEDVKDKVLQNLKELYEDISPKLLYYKTLYNIFYEYLHDLNLNEQTERQVLLHQSQIWQKLYLFQRDAVKAIIQKLEKYNGCILADSVGLGKTFTALGVIKYYESRNYRVLILCPKNLRENWTQYTAYTGDTSNPFFKDRFSYIVLNHTDLREEGKQGDIELSKFNWGMFDLVVIDESHNFRNDTKGKYLENGKYKKSRYEKLMQDVIQAGVNTKVLLLSATPVNVHLKDLRNQIYFFTKEKDDAFRELGVTSLNQLLATAQRVFTEWASSQKAQSRKVSDLLQKLPNNFFTLLDALSIARSRKHIQTYYTESLSQMGNFPKREKPISIYCEIDLENRFPKYEDVEATIRQYKLSLFSPFFYLKENKKIEYEEKYGTRQAVNFKQEDREHYLIGMMKVNFLKRLESSINSFSLTMERTLQKIEDLLKKIKNFQNQEYQLQEKLEFGEEDLELQEALETGGKLKYLLKDMELEKWKKDLEDDKSKISQLYNLAQAITPRRDAKLDQLKKLLKEKIQTPTKNKEGKLNKKTLIFTAFADTANYLYENLEAFAKEHKVHIALVTGSGNNKTTLGNNKFQDILINFSPISKGRASLQGYPAEEIDILIATDCISEGQNLQDCDFLINYDIHWNPVRVIQRFGRIDRIGSQNESVKLVNFWPTQDLDQYIKLQTRVEARMALVDISATNEDNLLSNEIKDLIEKDLSYRDAQIKRLQEEIIDLEELQDSVSLADFSLEEFRAELLAFFKEKKQELEKIPDGVYALVNNKFTNSTTSENEKVPSGVIFLLKSKKEKLNQTTINPYHPFYLAYVKSNGEIYYKYFQIKQILEIYKALCKEKTKPDIDLCKNFLEETNQGKNMEEYNKLLTNVVNSITGTVQNSNVANLFYGGTGVLEDQSNLVTQADDFELITWLIIKED